MTWKQAQRWRYGGGRVYDGSEKPQGSRSEGKGYDVKGHVSGRLTSDSSVVRQSVPSDMMITVRYLGGAGGGGGGRGDGNRMGDLARPHFHDFLN